MGPFGPGSVYPATPEDKMYNVRVRLSGVNHVLGRLHYVICKLLAIFDKLISKNILIVTKEKYIYYVRFSFLFGTQKNHSIAEVIFEKYRTDNYNHKTDFCMVVLLKERMEGQVL